MSCSGKLSPIYDDGKLGTTQDSMYFLVETNEEGQLLVDILNSTFRVNDNWVLLALVNKDNGNTLKWMSGMITIPAGSTYDSTSILMSTNTTQTISGNKTFNNLIGINNTNVLEFGVGVSGKEINAGKIGYQTYSGTSLDIIGAGTSGINRNVKIYDNLNVNNNTLIQGNTTINSSLYVSNNTIIFILHLCLFCQSCLERVNT